MLERNFHLCSERIKIQLFNMYCNNIYCASLWSNYTITVYKKIEVAYNNSLRILLNLPKFSSASDMFVSRHVNTMDAQIRKQMYSLKCHIESCNNPLPAYVFTSEMMLYSRWLKTANSTLYFLA